jgi:hypothetical protein
VVQVPALLAIGAGFLLAHSGIRATYAGWILLVEVATAVLIAGLVAEPWGRVSWLGLSLTFAQASFVLVEGPARRAFERSRRILRHRVNAGISRRRGPWRIPRAEAGRSPFRP